MKYLLILSLALATFAFANVPVTNSGDMGGSESSYVPHKDVLFDQSGLNMTTVSSSEWIAAFSLDSRVADDFDLATSVGGWTLESVSWWGGWWNPGYSGPPTTISIFLYDDAGDIPTDPAAGGEFWSYNTATFTETPDGAYYQYDIPIDAGSQPDLDGDTTYWIAVQLEHAFPPQGGAACETTNVYGIEAHFGCAYFGYPNWASSSAVWGSPYSVCFVLEGSEIDVTAPYASDRDPDNGDTGVAVDADIVFHVQDDISGVDIGSINTSSVLVTDDTKATITGTIDVDSTDPNNVIVTFDPDSDFVDGSTVTVTASPAGNAITDYEVNEMATDTWSFEVIPAGVDSASLGIIKAEFK